MPNAIFTLLLRNGKFICQDLKDGFFSVWVKGPLFMSEIFEICGEDGVPSSGFSI